MEVDIIRLLPHSAPKVLVESWGSTEKGESFLGGDYSKINAGRHLHPYARIPRPARIWNSLTICGMEAGGPMGMKRRE